MPLGVGGRLLLTAIATTACSAGNCDSLAVETAESDVGGDPGLACGEGGIAEGILGEAGPE